MAIRAEDMWRSSRKNKENDEWDGAAGRLSERLLLAAEVAWQEAMEKRFLLEMADGTLSPERFRYYMLIDYLYLIEYIKTLRIIEERSGEPEIKSFLQNTIGATEEELGRVHFPNMMQLGITEEVISKTALPQEAEEYIRYMRSLAQKRPILESLTALLDCSWAYAYIAEHMIEQYGEKIRNSRYRDWFMAYITKEYMDSNQAWIDMVDALAEALDEEREEELCRIFVTCAGYENEFWDAVYCGEV
jgi:thiaminase/transcriptional activator TenA